MTLRIAVGMLLAATACGLGPALWGLPRQLAGHALALAPLVGLALAIMLLLLVSATGVAAGPAAWPVLGILLATSALLARGRIRRIDPGEAGAAALILPLALLAGGLAGLEAAGGGPQTLTCFSNDPVYYASTGEYLRTRPAFPLPEWPVFDRPTSPIAGFPGLILTQNHRFGSPLLLAWFGSLAGRDGFELFTILQAICFTANGLAFFVLCREGLGLARPAATATAMLWAYHPLMLVIAADGFQPQLLAFPLAGAGLLVVHVGLAEPDLGPVPDPDAGEFVGLTLGALLLAAALLTYKEVAPFVLAGLAGTWVDRARGRHGPAGTAVRLLAIGLLIGLLAAPSTLGLVAMFVRRWQDSISYRFGYPLVLGWPTLVELTGYGVGRATPATPDLDPRILGLFALGLLALGARRTRAKGLVGAWILTGLALGARAAWADDAYLYHKVYSMTFHFPLGLAALGAVDLGGGLRERVRAGGARSAAAAAAGVAGALLGAAWVRGGVQAGSLEATRLREASCRVSAQALAWREALARDPGLTRLCFPAGAMPERDALWVAYWMRDRELWFEAKVNYLDNPGGPPPGPGSWLRVLPEPDRGGLQGPQ